MKYVYWLIGLLVYFLWIPVGVAAQRLMVLPTATPVLLVPRVIDVSTPIPPTATPQARRKVEVVLPSSTPTPVVDSVKLNPKITLLPTLTPTPFTVPRLSLPVRKNPIALDIDAGRMMVEGRAITDEASDSARIKPLTVDLVNSTGSPAGSLQPVLLNEGKAGLTFDYEGQEATVTARVHVRFRQGKTIAVIGDQEYPLLYSPKAFYAAMMAAARFVKAEVNDVLLVEANGKPVYRFASKQTIKILGVIPYSRRELVEIDASTNEVIKKGVSRWTSWLPFQSWDKAYAIGPNLRIQDVHMYQQSYHTGDTARIVFTLTNTGTKSYLPYGKYITVMWRAGEQSVATHLENPFLDPGESQTYTGYTWNGFKCNYPISLEVDTGNVMNETTKNDNIWQGVTECAPDTGPDIAVITLKPGAFNGERVIGQPQPETYTLQNLGNTSSAATRGLMKTLGGQYLSLFDIPPLDPGATFTGIATYTPIDCSLVEVITDSDKKNTEINEDNNYATEDPAIEDHCRKRPDLTIDWIYWLHDGFSFGKPKAGEVLHFEVRIANASVDHDFGCAPNVTLGVYQDGNGILNVPVGDIGVTSGSCSGGGIWGTYDYPYIAKTTYFTYTAVCGVNLAFIADQENQIPEADETNNRKDIWIECE